MQIWWSEPITVKIWIFFLFIFLTSSILFWVIIYDKDLRVSERKFYNFLISLNPFSEKHRKIVGNIHDLVWHCSNKVNNVELRYADRRCRIIYNIIYNIKIRSNKISSRWVEIDRKIKLFISTLCFCFHLLSYLLPLMLFVCAYLMSFITYFSLSLKNFHEYLVNFIFYDLLPYVRLTFVVINVERYRNVYNIDENITPASVFS